MEFEEKMKRAQKDIFNFLLSKGWKEHTVDYPSYKGRISRTDLDRLLNKRKLDRYIIGSLPFPIYFYFTRSRQDGLYTIIEKPAPKS